jgi:hypothetical protein
VLHQYFCYNEQFDWNFSRTYISCGGRIVDLCGPVVTVPGYGSEMYCVPCEVQTEFIYVM